MGTPARSRATFRIGADIVTEPPGALPDVSVVTKKLGLSPSRAHSAGDPVSPKTPKRTAMFKHGQWALASPLPADTDINMHLQWLIGQLLPLRDRIYEVLASDPRLRADFFCGVWLASPNDGITLSVATLTGLAELGTEIGLDIYEAEHK